MIRVGGDDLIVILEGLIIAPGDDCLIGGPEEAREGFARGIELALGYGGLR